MLSVVKIHRALADPKENEEWFFPLLLLWLSIGLQNGETRKIQVGLNLAIIKRTDHHKKLAARLVFQCAPSSVGGRPWQVMTVVTVVVKALHA